MPKDREDTRNLMVSLQANRAREDPAILLKMRRTPPDGDTALSSDPFTANPRILFLADQFVELKESKYTP